MYPLLYGGRPEFFHALTRDDHWDLLVYLKAHTGYTIVLFCEGVVVFCRLKCDIKWRVTQDRMIVLIGCISKEGVRGWCTAELEDRKVQQWYVQAVSRLVEEAVQVVVGMCLKQELSMVEC